MTAFLYGPLPPDKAQCLEQLESFAEPGKEVWVWCLQHGLYYMKQNGHIWNKTTHNSVLKSSLVRFFALKRGNWQLQPV
jgi:hypothetical protein